MILEVKNDFLLTVDIYELSVSNLMSLFTSFIGITRCPCDLTWGHRDL